MLKKFGMRIPNTLPAEDWIASGHKWEPDVYILVGDLFETRFVEHLISEFRQYIVAYSFNDSIPCVVSIELQCDTPEHGREIRVAYGRALTQTGMFKPEIRAYFEDQANIRIHDHGHLQPQQFPSRKQKAITHSV